MSRDGPCEWIRMYRQGVGGASIARLCDVDDVLQVLKTLNSAKAADRGLEAEHLANLNRHARDVEETMAVARAFTPAWRRRLAELEKFVKCHRCMPRQTGGDTAETGLGRWLHAQRSKVDKGTLDPRQRTALDAIGCWDSDRRAVREQTRFPARLDAVAGFKARHNRWPTYMNRADEEERALGTWLHTARQAASGGRLSPALREAMDAKLPGWNY